MIKTKRSPEQPKSLTTGHYGKPDVIEVLLRDFLGKCYLCEACITTREVVVDHRKPKAKFPELKCAWSNLFPICRDCNERRPKTYPSDGLLDPASDDINGRLFQTVQARDATGDEIPHFSAVDQEDVCSIATARELDHVHNAPSYKAADLRDAIAGYVDDVLTKILSFQDHEGVVHGPVRKLFEDDLRRAFARGAPFTAIVRGRLGAGFEHLFD